MYSTFYFEDSDAECLVCTNKSLKSLGTLQGIFAAQIDRVNQRIEVEHTDEVTREKIAQHLTNIGYIIVE